MQERSLTVPQMLSLPILPPGKNCGETMNPSVVMAILPFGAGSTEASSAVKYGFSKCARNTFCMSSEVCFPPAPCAIVTVSFMGNSSCFFSV